MLGCSYTDTYADCYTRWKQHAYTQSNLNSHSYCYCYSYSKRYSYSGCYSNSNANRSSNHVKSDAGLNLYLFERHFSMERGQCYWLCARNWELTGWQRHFRLEHTTRPFPDCEQYSDRWAEHLRQTLLSGQRILDIQQLHLQSVQFFSHSNSDANPDSYANSNHDRYSYPNSNSHRNCNANC